jgi:hypothetical protein
MSEMINNSELTCPTCGHKDMLELPTDYCQWFYECSNCQALLKPKQGDCCVFCSYGTAPCPSIQLQNIANIKGDCNCGQN